MHSIHRPYDIESTLYTEDDFSKSALYTAIYLLYGFPPRPLNKRFACCIEAAISYDHTSTILKDRFQLTQRSPKENNSIEDGPPQYLYGEFVTFLSYQTHDVLYTEGRYVRGTSFIEHALYTVFSGKKPRLLFFFSREKTRLTIKYGLYSRAAFIVLVVTPRKLK